MVSPFGRSRWLVPALAAGGGLLAGLGAAVIVVVILLASAEKTPVDDFGEALLLAPAAAEPIDERQAAGEILVDVAGAVVRPGLHRLEAGARVGDALEAAGGFAPRADLAAAAESLNLALTLEDGVKVLVPELGNERAVSTGTADGRIDINRADQAELETLPGIGPVTAGKIIAARNERRFESVRDLRTRGLVGESVFADIKSRLSAS
jgi:competence protein ComEA